MKRSEQGFTIIELVVVIAILGILGAVALPKFANLTGQARTSAYQGVVGGFSAAVMIAHSQWLADGGSGATVTLEGTTVNMTGAGWPSVTGASAGDTLWTAIMNGQVPNDWVASADTTTGVATYTFASGAGVFTYADSTGVVTQTTVP